MLASLLLVCGLGATACTAHHTTHVSSDRPPAPSGAFALAAFSSCDDALRGLRSAADASVGPYGLPGDTSIGYMRVQAGLDSAGAPAAPMSAGMAAGADPIGGTDYSRTNDHEIGVDEPDIVKTDGHRIVTISNGVLRVVDVATQSVTGQLILPGDARSFQTNLLLDGDHALVLVYGDFPQFTPQGDLPQGDLSPGATPQATLPQPSKPVGPRLFLVDLTGTPSVIASYSIDGWLLDARQVGDTVRVVVRSSPRIRFPAQLGPTSKDDARVASNRAAIEHAGIADWLPRIQTIANGKTRDLTVPCDNVRRPVSYSGSNFLTVLTFDASRDDLGSGEPVSIAADGDTVYGTEKSLYVANDDRWRLQIGLGGMVMGGAATGGVAAAGPVAIAPGETVGPAESNAPGSPPKLLEQTTVYRFDTSQPGPPAYVAAGTVPGYLVNQYAMSEWDNTLRLATTTDMSWTLGDGRQSNATKPESAVYVLSTDGPVMRTVGSVGGLGAQERIYAVRFIGTVAYVVTFRQTDPLYTVDLSDPAHPRVRGALELTGFSSYLHPATDSRLIGIGQQADGVGRVSGTQISLFDVSDIAKPSRVAAVALTGTFSNAESNPYAFLYWPADGLVVVPLSMYTTNQPDGVLVLRATDKTLTKVGFLQQSARTNHQALYRISRSLVVGGTLWTLSDAGLMANDLTDLARVAWVPFV
ncbi:MAG TPA: beta-propeller domain-containing protein [Micromonosporaceae bacterium]